MSERVKRRKKQGTNNRSLRSAVRVTNLLCAWHRVVSCRPPGQRSVTRRLGKWQTLPWCRAMFANTGQLLTLAARTKRERGREDRSKGEGGAIWTSEQGERNRQRVMEETGVTVTTGERWRERWRGTGEVAGWCFCSLTAWQSPLD